MDELTNKENEESSKESEFIREILEHISQLKQSLDQNKLEIEVLKAKGDTRETDEIRIFEKLIAETQRQDKLLKELTHAVESSIKHFSLIYKRLDNLEKYFK